MMKRSLLFSLLVMSLLDACGGSNLSTNISAGASKTACIPAIATFSYPVNQEINSDSAETQVLPLDPWKFETQLPSLPDGANSYSFTVLARENKDVSKGAEVWIRRNWWFTGERVSEPGGTQILVYHPATKEWRVISNLVQGTQGQVSEMFLGDDGSIWVDGYIVAQHFLGIYDDVENVFRLVKGGEHVPEGRVLLDHDGKLWIVKPQDGIYSFDPISMEVKKHADIPDLLLPSGSEITPIVLASDASIYIVNEAGDGGSELIRFFQETGEIERNVEIALDYPWPIYSLFVDQLGQLWLHDLGWKDLNGVWHQIIRSPVFIVNRNSGVGSNFSWPYANIVLESSDGALWFRSENGMTRLNPQNGEWCWFTTYSSRIVEDAYHNLWMIADDKLYKLSLGK